jgi:hypothetical protein
MNSLTSHHDPHYPTPVLSKAKTAPPLGKGRGWGWGKTYVGQAFELKLTPMGEMPTLQKILLFLEVTFRWLVVIFHSQTTTDKRLS